MKIRTLFYSIYLLLFVVLFAGCSNPEVQEQFPVIIDMQNSFTGSEGFNTENVFDEILFIPLETKEECVVSNRPRFYADEKFIVKDGSKQIYLFDRQTGNFIREIGVNDQSPEGYRSSGNGAVFNEQNQLVYASGWNGNYCAYNFQGKKAGNVKLPENEQVFTFGSINDSVFAGYLINFMGDQKFKIVLFDEKGEMLKKYPNYNSFKKVEQSISVITYEGLFYNYNNGLFFKELFDDTLFQVKTDTLLPRYVFNGGKFNPVYENREELVQSKPTVDGGYKWGLDDCYTLTNLVESSRFMIFELRFQKKSFFGIYDKTEKTTKIAENNLEIKVGENAFLPLKITNVYINSKNELVTYIDAFELAQWMQENPEKIKKLPEQYQPLKNITENDNPVVVIAKLKS